MTAQPLSTSLCPVAAFENARHKGKAYDADRLDLIVLRVTDPKTKVFVFKHKGTKQGHECEVLLAPGAFLKFHCERKIRSDFPATNIDQPYKEIPVYLVEVEVS